MLKKIINKVIDERILKYKCDAVVKELEKHYSKKVVSEHEDLRALKSLFNFQTFSYEEHDKNSIVFSRMKIVGDVIAHAFSKPFNKAEIINKVDNIYKWSEIVRSQLMPDEEPTKMKFRGKPVERFNNFEEVRRIEKDGYTYGNGMFIGDNKAFIIQSIMCNDSLRNNGVGTVIEVIPDSLEKCE